MFVVNYSIEKIESHPKQKNSTGYEYGQIPRFFISSLIHLRGNFSQLLEGFLTKKTEDFYAFQ